MNQAKCFIVFLKISLPVLYGLLKSTIFGLLDTFPMCWFFIGQTQVEVAIEPDDGLLEVEIVIVHHEIDHSARRPAAETFVSVVMGL